MQSFWPMAVCLVVCIVCPLISILYLFREIYRIATVRLILVSLSKTLVAAHLLRGGRLDAAIKCVDAAMEEYLEILDRYRVNRKQAEVIEVIELVGRYKVLYQADSQISSVRVDA